MKSEHLRQAQSLVICGILYAPVNFLKATQTELEEKCNGCGAEDSWFRPPERIYGTLIVYACIIHDWMYHEGRTIEDKEEADRVFLNNMNRLISRDKNKWYKPTFLQRRRAIKYYRAVDLCGGDAFWNGKNHL